MIERNVWRTGLVLAEVATEFTTLLPGVRPGQFLDPLPFLSGTGVFYRDPTQNQNRLLAQKYECPGRRHTSRNTTLCSQNSVVALPRVGKNRPFQALQEDPHRSTPDLILKIRHFASKRRFSEWKGEELR